jgi:hypothetical protein
MYWWQRDRGFFVGAYIWVERGVNDTHRSSGRSFRFLWFAITQSNQPCMLLQDAVVFGAQTMVNASAMIVTYSNK